MRAVGAVSCIVNVTSQQEQHSAAHLFKTSFKLLWHVHLQQQRQQIPYVLLPACIGSLNRQQTVFTASTAAEALILLYSSVGLHRFLVC